MKGKAFLWVLLIAVGAVLWLAGCDREEAGVSAPVAVEQSEILFDEGEAFVELDVSAEEVNAAGQLAYQEQVRENGEKNACVSVYLPYLSQLDSRWKNQSLGYNYNGTSTIGNQGCYLTCLVMLYQKWGYWSMTPPVLNNWSYQGQAHYAFSTSGNGDLIYYPQALQYGYMSRPTRFVSSYSLIYNELAAGRPVVAQIRTASMPSHFVVIYAFNGTSYLVRDPLGQSSRPLYGTIVSLRVHGA